MNRKIFENEINIAVFVVYAPEMKIYIYNKVLDLIGLVLIGKRDLFVKVH